MTDRTGVGRPIRLLELIDTGEIGGGQVHVADLLARLDRADFEITACAGPESPFGRRIAGLDVGRIPVDVGGWAGAAAFVRLVREIRARGIDLLHLHGGVAGMWGRLAARLGGDPAVVCTFHGLHFFHKRNRTARRLIAGIERRLAPRTDGAIFVSEHDRRLGIGSGVLSAASVAVIRNGIDPGRFMKPVDRAAIRASLGLPADATVLGCVGRLHRQKGHEDLLRAMEGPAGRHPGLRLLLVGDGPLRGRLEARASEAGLADRVVFCGFREDVPELLGALDLLLLPSLWEGLPVVLLEAMAAGTPVVASRIGGVDEVIDDGESGRLFAPGRPAEIAGVIEAFLARPEVFRSMAERARQVVTERFTVERMVGETGSFLRKVHRSRSGRGKGR